MWWCGSFDCDSRGERGVFGSDGTKWYVLYLVLLFFVLFGNYVNVFFIQEEEGRERCQADGKLIGGHFKPDPFARAASVLKTHGKAVAEHVTLFEARQVSEIRELVEREGVDCDFEETRIADVCLYMAGRDKIKADVDRVAAAGISTASGITYSVGVEAEKVCRYCILLFYFLVVLIVHADIWHSRSVVLSHIPCCTVMALPAGSSLTRESHIEGDQLADTHTRYTCLPRSYFLRRQLLDRGHTAWFYKDQNRGIRD